ncbi:MAG TPA: septum formation family protein [Nocardioides sp.]|nr:septum formation family protein [Nocardioides sp.]
MRPALRTVMLVAAVLSALLTLLGVTTNASADPVARGVDITPPAIGTCHDLTYDEAWKPSDTDPAVDCSTSHTTVTVKVVTFAKTPDWSDGDALYRRYDAACHRGILDLFAGKAKALQASAYGLWIFFPTKAQRDAGAKWIRCDAALTAGETLAPLPTDGAPTLDALPLDDGVARCRRSKSSDYFATACSKAHSYRATEILKYPSATYPGLRRMKAWANRKCYARLGRSFGYYEWPTRAHWAVGLRYSLCFKTTTS